MTTPMRPVPAAVEGWIARRRWLRACDYLTACALLGAGAAAVLGPARLEAAAVVTLALASAGAALQPIRVRWRPVTGWVGLRLSRALRPGQRAWYLGTSEARLVVVTARRGVRLVIVRPDLVEDEGISVRRTRVFLLAADGR
ncbi:MAG TPA: hypothetical protein VFV05_25615 [Methylomirabilota bacterium]|nr:hypothetical protein [Methylomirabilota bacterium]